MLEFVKNNFVTNYLNTFYFFISGGRSDEVVAELVVRDANHGSNPPANAQPPAGRDDASERAEVRALVAGSTRRTLHA